MGLPFSECHLNKVLSKGSDIDASDVCREGGYPNVGDQKTSKELLPDKSKPVVKRGRKATDQVNALIAGLPKEGERNF